MIYFIAIAFLITIKNNLLEDGGYRIMGRIIGRDATSIDFLWQLSFFATDLWLLLLGIPLALVILYRFVGERGTTRSVYVLALASTALAFLHMNVLASTGKFLTWDQIAPMLAWARERPSSIFEYVSIRSLCKFAAIVTTIVILYHYRHRSLFVRFDAAFPLAIFFAVTVSAIAACAVLIDQTPRGLYHAPVAARMVTEIFGSDSSASLSKDIVAGRIDYTCEGDSLLTTKKASASSKPNIVLFLMETIPYELYSFGKKKGLPNMEALESKALVAQQHFTTYPFTSYARFSILTGLYPPYRLEKTVKLDRSNPYRSAFSSLVGQGYDFTLFDPVTHRYPVDDWAVRQLGGNVVSTDIESDPLAKDKALLGVLIDRIGASAKSSTPFIYAYLPQLTHGPWLASGASKEALYEEGYRRLKTVDDSLGELVAALERHGVRENTVIVLTADHGLRTRQEAGFLKTVVLNEASYHVPLVIYDPRLAHSIVISRPTSHVDISPTLHCAYGNAHARIESQGSDLASAKPAPRSIRFGGEWYNGSGGIWSNGSFYSYNAQLRMLWKSPVFDFDEGGPLQRLEPEAGILQQLAHANQAQEKLLAEQFDILLARAHEHGRRAPEN
ncbi:sulfatase-like hydrolase/transferase [Massilia litorea]|uniref:Sulfatase-like hydrolase/transferase n=1 Tax=Massilia litorea TaxID=2769491 RepID=A0A7L9U7Z5_9BURK|nr:sulfatase-like hydrolase/transferase [Massilia litorea]QOL51154.1 sulfatase-like hydrolase/transferase [Massilia litorea]